MKRVLEDENILKNLFGYSYEYNSFWNIAEYSSKWENKLYKANNEYNEFVDGEYWDMAKDTLTWLAIKGDWDCKYDNKRLRSVLKTINCDDIYDYLYISNAEDYPINPTEIVCEVINEVKKSDESVALTGLSQRAEDLQIKMDVALMNVEAISSASDKVASSIDEGLINLGSRIGLAISNQTDELKKSISSITCCSYSDDDDVKEKEVVKEVVVERGYDL